MQIDLRKFVDVNIQAKVDSIVVGTRDVTALFTSYGVKGEPKIVSNMTEVNELYEDEPSAANILAYAETYFEHGGSKLAIYEGYQTVVKTDIESLPDKYINVAFANLDYAAIKSLALSIANDTSIYGIKEKILFASTNVETDEDKIKNFAVKYSTRVVGAEMTMCAYLSKINVYGVDTVYDYAFTQEQILPETSLTDAEFDELTSNNFNFDIVLANATRVCGGNCKDGSELTNAFVRIVLHQTLTERLLQLLTQKIKSNTGLGKIYSTITQELSAYLACGYLTTDKVWLDDDLTVTVNEKSYTIIEKGTALTNGYAVAVLPMTSLTAQEKALHQAPKIYVIVADQYAIRKITINGEVI